MKNKILWIVTWIAYVLMIIYIWVDQSNLVAIINNERIHRWEYEEYLSTRETELVSAYTQDKIDEQALSAIGITVTNKEINQEYDETVTAYGGQEEFDKVLSDKGMTVKEYKYNIKKTILSEKAMEFYSKDQRVSKADIEKRYQERITEGDEIIIMDCRTIKINESDNLGSVNFEEFDQDRVKEELNIQTNTIFDGVPNVGDVKITSQDGTSMLVKVDAVYRGIDNEKVYNYIEEMLKQEKALDKYKQYLTDKRNSAEIKFK